MSQLSITRKCEIDNVERDSERIILNYNVEYGLIVSLTVSDTIVHITSEQVRKFIYLLLTPLPYESKDTPSDVRCRETSRASRLYIGFTEDNKNIGSFISHEDRCTILKYLFHYGDFNYA